MTFDCPLHVGVFHFGPRAQLAYLLARPILKAFAYMRPHSPAAISPLSSLNSEQTKVNYVIIFTSASAAELPCRKVRLLRLKAGLCAPSQEKFRTFYLSGIFSPCPVEAAFRLTPWRFQRKKRPLGIRSAHIKSPHPTWSVYFLLWKRWGLD